MIHMKSDLVCIGGGACGLTAALTVSYGGGTAIVLEKMPTVGGLTRFAEGMFAVESKYQRRMKLDLTVESCFTTHMNDTHWKADPRLVRTIMARSADTIDWLEEQGCEFSGVVCFYPGGPFVWHMLKGSEDGKTLSSSAAPAQYGLIRPLLEKAKNEKNIQILTDTEAVRIIREEERITGVHAKSKSGEEIVIEAKTVLCATGGYNNKPEWMRSFVAGGEYMRPFSDSSRQTGDSIRMAWEVGAAEDGLGIVQTYPFVVDTGASAMLNQAGQQPNLWVNELGERYCNEMICTKFPLAINALMRQPHGTAYNIMDYEFIESLQTTGCPYNNGEYYEPGAPLAGLDAELDRAERAGKLFVSDTIEGLAAKIGVNTETFIRNVREYNDCCDSNHDSVFAKDRKHLHSIKKPRFYAFKIMGCCGITEGGIRINHKMEVIDTEFAVIPGLYAGGCAAGGFMEGDYVMSTSGGSLCFALNSGRIAGENVLRYIGRS